MKLLFKLSTICGLFLCLPAYAETLEELQQAYDEYIKKTDDAVTPERYELAQRLAIFEQYDRSEIDLLDWYSELSKSDRAKLEKVHFEYAKGVQKRYPNSTYVHTAVCWSALLQNRMPIAKNACKRAYENDFVYGPSIVNMGHISYFNGDIENAKSFYNQSLIGTDLNYDWVASIKEDFELLTNIYTPDAQQKLSAFVESESKQTWYTNYEKLDDQAFAALEADNMAKAMSLKQQMQQVVSERFGKDSLINAYELSGVERYQKKAGEKFDSEIHQKIVSILNRYGLNKDNSELASFLLKPLED